MAIRTIRLSFSDNRVRRSLFGILRSNVLCSMATVTQPGRAHINTAYFGYSDKPELYFLSYPDSVHCKNLLRNPSMAMTVFRSAQTWGKPDTGLQLFGACHEAKGRWAEKAETIYSRRFTGHAKWRGQIQKEEGAFGLRFYRFVPTEAKILDEKKFGAGTFVKVRMSNRRGQS